MRCALIGILTEIIGVIKWLRRLNFTVSKPAPLYLKHYTVLVLRCLGRTANRHKCGTEKGIPEDGPQISPRQESRSWRPGM